MSPLLFIGSALFGMVSTAPLIPKVDEFITDLNAAGNFMAAYVKTYPEYKDFYQLGLPIAVTFTLSEEQRRDAMATVYKQYGPKDASSNQMMNDVTTLLSTVETTKDEYLTNYFAGNTARGLELLSRAGYLFAEDYYLDAQFIDKKDMLKALVNQFL